MRLQYNTCTDSGVSCTTFRLDILSSKRDPTPSSWCGPCKFLSPILEEVTADSPQPTRTGSGRTIDLLTVNVDEQGELAAQFKARSGDENSRKCFVTFQTNYLYSPQVRSIPLVVAFKDGVEVDRFIGAKNKEGVLEFVGKL